MGLDLVTRAWVREKLVSGLVYGALGFLLTAAIWGVISAVEYSTVRGVPVERAEVSAVEPSGTREVCSRSFLPLTPGERVTYRVRTPRPGWPDTFTLTQCPGAALGDVVTVHRPDQDETLLNAVDSPAEAVLDSLAAGAIAGGLALLLFTLYAAAGGVLLHLTRPRGPSRGRHATPR